MPINDNYLEAILEYESFPEDQKPAYIYSFVGYALYVTQHLEKHLMNAIWGYKVVNRKEETDKELSDYFDKYEFGKYTMGMLLKAIKKILDISRDDILELENVLKKRNHLIHNYFNLNNNLLYAPNGYKIIIKDFLEYIEHVNRIEEKIIAYNYTYLEKLGKTKEALDKMINQEVENWSKQNIDEEI